MPVQRTVKFTFSFNCCYRGNAKLKNDVISEENEYIEDAVSFDTPLEIWAEKSAKEIAEEIAKKSCEELNDKFSKCLVVAIPTSYVEMEIPEKQKATPDIIKRKEELESELAELYSKYYFE